MPMPTIMHDPMEIRRRIATAWTHDAMMEHASIASFARFALELLALGAPPKLLIQAQDAGTDEINHAMKCFAIASRFAGKKLGPGPLDVSGVEPARDVASIVAATVKEGCVVETISAMFAEARAEGAVEPDVRAAMKKIAADESRHAELAWQFVAWALGRGGEPVREVVLQALAEAKRPTSNPIDPVLRGLPAPLVRAHGLLDEETSVRVRRQALEAIEARLAGMLADA
jgi:hypothetical protein